MKKLVSLLALLFIFSSHIFALSIKREGEPQLIEGHYFQKCLFQDEQDRLTFLLPGSPKFGLSDNWWYAYAEVEDTFYELHTHNVRYLPPQNKEAIFVDLSRQLGPENHLHVVDLPPESGIKYSVQWQMQLKETTKVVRMYVTDNRAYYLIIEGAQINSEEAHLIFNSAKLEG